MTVEKLKEDEVAGGADYMAMKSSNKMQRKDWTDVDIPSGSGSKVSPMRNLVTRVKR